MHDYALALLLMGRQLRSIVPSSMKPLKPETPDAAKLHQIENSIKQRQASNYNKRHRRDDRSTAKSGSPI